MTFQTEIREILRKHVGSNVALKSTQFIGGGSINSALRLHTSSGDYFLKHNDGNLHLCMFEREALGLELLAASKTLHTPFVIATGSVGDQDYILLEFLHRGKTVSDFWENFGTQLAQMHQCTQEVFGLDHDNYMGSLKQSNEKRKEFVPFFIDNRLQPQLELAIGHRTMRDLIPEFEELYKRLPELIPSEKPSLVHGDLWSGNFLIGPEGKACLIDPAVSYNHRECDIAMTKLFGGFDRAFYDAYNNAFPLERGWEERIDIFNLYPLLVHVNLFGGGYVQQVAAIVRRFS